MQLYARRELDPDNLSKADRLEIRKLIDSLGLEIPALCGDTGGPRFMEIASHRERIDKSKRIIDLAVEWSSNVITGHIGTIPADPKDELYIALQKACREIGDYAASLGARYAIETGPETAEHLRTFLDSIGSAGLAVNYDPANLWMVQGDDPVKGVHTLKDYIVHTHVKDGVRTETVENGQTVYGYYETPAGSGQIDFPAYFAALHQIGYTGYLTVEREKGEVPERELTIRNAVKLIREMEV